MGGIVLAFVSVVVGIAAAYLLGDLNIAVLVVVLLAVSATMIKLLWHYDLAAPAAVFGIVWSVATAGAQITPFDQPAWHLQMWLVAIIRPGMLFIAAFAVTGRAAIRRQPLGLRVAPGIAVPMQISLVEFADRARRVR